MRTMRTWWKKVTFRMSIAGFSLLAAWSSFGQTVTTNVNLVNPFSTGPAAQVQLEIQVPTDFTGGSWCLVFGRSSDVYCFTNTSDVTIFVNPSNMVSVTSYCVSGYAFAPPQTQYLNPGSSNATVVITLLPRPSVLPTLLLNLQPGQATVTLSNGLPQYTYQVDYTSNLQAAWSPLGQVTIPDIGGNAVLLDNNLKTNRFYRALWVHCP